MSTRQDVSAGPFFVLVLILSLPFFYVLGATGAHLPFVPALPISAVMVCVPMIAALALVARHSGVVAAGALFKSAFNFRSIPRVWCLVVALGFMPTAFVLTGSLVWLSGTPLPALQPAPASAVVAAFALFFLGAVAEEIGWQGYAYPRLKMRYSPLQAGLIIGVVWALWHVIPFALMGRSAGWIIWHGAAIILMRLIIVWLYENAGHSILIAVLFHMMSNSVWGLFANFDPYYDPMLMCLVLLASMTAVICLWGPMTPGRRGWRFVVLAIGVTGAGFSTIIAAGLPMRGLRLADIVLIGAANDFATDKATDTATVRPDLFSGAAQRVVPFQMLYPARSPGAAAFYVPDAEAVIDAIADSHGWMSRVMLGQIGTLPAPWTDAAPPAAGGPFPVIIYLPGVTGYMQMGSFQTTELAAQGYVVVTLNQPGAVAAAVLPDNRIVAGLTRANAALLIKPSYLGIAQPLPDGFAQMLAPDQSIIPYFAADVPLVLDRLAQINADPAHILHGLLDLDRVGVMGMSLGAIVTAQACAMDARSGARIDACLMMDASVPTEVAAIGLRQPALWISRPASDQRLERAASGGWPDEEIDAQATTIAQALSNSDHGQLVQLHGLFHIDFTDLPAIQPVIGWLGQSGPGGVEEAHSQINQLTTAFFAKAFGTVWK